MEAPGHMKSPGHYGVTFERGTELLFGDRKHMYISGTASINEEGDVLYVGDVVKQTERAFQNIESLLIHSNATFKDMAYFVVYLRDASDIFTIRDVIKQQGFVDVPILFLHSSVCRPDWLVEIEGVAIAPSKDELLPNF